jgi:hypothetical protein
MKTCPGEGGRLVTLLWSSLIQLAPCHFVNFQWLYKQPPEQSVVKLQYANNPALTNKTLSDKKPFPAAWGSSVVVSWGFWCGDTTVQGSYIVNEPATEKGTELKKEILSRIRCIQ